MENSLLAICDKMPCTISNTRHKSVVIKLDSPTTLKCIVTIASNNASTSHTLRRVWTDSKKIDF